MAQHIDNSRVLREADTATHTTRLEKQTRVAQKALLKGCHDGMPHGMAQAASLIIRGLWGNCTAAQAHAILSRLACLPTSPLGIQLSGGTAESIITGFQVEQVRTALESRLGGNVLQVKTQNMLIRFWNIPKNPELHMGQVRPYHKLWREILWLATIATANEATACLRMLYSPEEWGNFGSDGFVSLPDQAGCQMQSYHRDELGWSTSDDLNPPAPLSPWTIRILKNYPGSKVVGGVVIHPLAKRTAEPAFDVFNIGNDDETDDK